MENASSPPARTIQHECAGLQAKVFREDIVNYILDQFEDKLARELENIGGEMDGMKRRKEELLQWSIKG
jgi:hypothetical protein